MVDRLTAEQVQEAAAAGVSFEDVLALAQTDAQRDLIAANFPADDLAPVGTLIDEELAAEPSGAGGESDAPVPQLRQRHLFGFPVEGNEHPGQAPSEVGVFGSARLGFGTAWLDVQQRWASLADDADDPVPTGPEIEELLDGRSMEIPRGTSRREIERRIGMHDREQYLSQYSTGMVGEFVGALPPYFLDPTSLALAPVGGAKIRAATQSGTLGGFLRESTTAGARIGAASLPLELGIQQRTRGEVDGTSVLLSSIAPVVATPVFASPAWARTGLRNERAVRTGISSEQMPVDTPPVRSSEAVAARNDIPSPPVREYTTPVQPPRARLNETFREYEGGSAQWIQDMAVGREGARTFAARIGVNPDSPVLRDMISQEGQATAQRTAAPASFERDVRAAVQRTEQGRPEARDTTTLQRAGLADTEGNLIPGVTSGALRRDGALAVRGQVQRSLENQMQLRSRVLGEARQQRDAAPEGSEARATADEFIDDTRRDIAVLEDQLAALQTQPRSIDAQASPERIMEALDAARVQDSPSGAAQAQARPQSPEADQAQLDAVVGRSEADDPDLVVTMEYARRQGISEEDVMAVNQRYGEFEQQLRACSGGRA